MKEIIMTCDECKKKIEMGGLTDRRGNDFCSEFCKEEYYYRQEQQEEELREKLNNIA
jgi:hypothetical protein